MGTRFIVGHEPGSAVNREVVVLFDSVTGIAFGPIIRELEGPCCNVSALDAAEVFLTWLADHHPIHERMGTRIRTDPRAYSVSTLMDLYAEWYKLAAEKHAFQGDAEECQLCGDNRGMHVDLEEPTKYF